MWPTTYFKTNAKVQDWLLHLVQARRFHFIFYAQVLNARPFSTGVPEKVETCYCLCYLFAEYIQLTICCGLSASRHGTLSCMICGWGTMAAEAEEELCAWTYECAMSVVNRTQMNIQIFEYSVTIRIFDYHLEYLNINFKENIIWVCKNKSRWFSDVLRRNLDYGYLIHTYAEIEYSNIR